MVDSRACKFVETGRVHYWGANVVDPSEPDFVPGKGVPLPLKDLQCRNVADAGETYCPKHKLLLEIANG